MWGEPLELDARVGGRYRWMMTVGTKTYTIYGTYREVKPPERLAFTWEWQNDPDHGESGQTLVTVATLGGPAGRSMNDRPPHPSR